MLRLILDAYYEPQSSDHSHGFRHGRGCHTALQEVYHGWVGTAWFIELDVAHFFDRALLAAAASPAPPPIDELTPDPLLRDELPEDLPWLVRLLPSADVYLQDEVESTAT